MLLFIATSLVLSRSFASRWTISLCCHLCPLQLLRARTTWRSTWASSSRWSCAWSSPSSWRSSSTARRTATLTRTSSTPRRWMGASSLLISKQPDQVWMECYGKPLRAFTLDFETDFASGWQAVYRCPLRSKVSAFCICNHTQQWCHRLLMYLLLFQCCISTDGLFASMHECLRDCGKSYKSALSAQKKKKKSTIQREVHLPATRVRQWRQVRSWTSGGSIFHVWSVTCVCPPPADAVKEKIQVLVSMPTLSNQNSIRRRFYLGEMSKNTYLQGTIASL